MATEKVGVYRKYHGKVPLDDDGNPLPKSRWPERRLFRWVVRWFGLDGNRYSRSFKARKEAKRFAEEKQMEIRDGYVDPPPDVTLKEFRKEHAEVMDEHLAPSTLGLHLKALDLLAGLVGPDRPLREVSTTDIERFRAVRLGTGIGAASSNREIRTLKAVFGYAVGRGYLRPAENPCLGVRLKKVARRKPAYCPPEEFRALVRAAPDALWRAYLVTLYTAGLRRGEAMNLTWKDVDFERGLVHVDRKTRSGYVQAWNPKDGERRSIPLPAQAVDLLAAWQSVAPDGCPYVFMPHGRWAYYRGRVEGRRWREGQDLVNNHLRLFKTLCRRAGVGPYTLHDMRRSCITNWASDLPIHVVQELAGHSDIQTTKDYYLSVPPEIQARVREIQARLVGPLSESGTDPLTDPLRPLRPKKRPWGKFPTAGVERTRS